MPDLQIRAYESADEDVVLSVWLRAWKNLEVYKHIDFDERLNSTFRSHWQKLASSAVVRVAILDNEIVGAITIDPNDKYVDQIFVAPEHSSQGAGTLLLEEAKKLCPNGFMLKVNGNNKRAVDFYLSNGFKLWSSQMADEGELIWKMRWKQHQ